MSKQGLKVVMRSAIFGAGFTALGIVQADEGMWTLHGFPAADVASKHSVQIDDAWLDQVQRSTVRLDGGCTGSFASEDGLILTNNHCVWSCVRNLSSEEENLSELGFNPASRDDERQCPGARVSVLMETEEITDEVHAATADKSDTEANEVRKATLSRLESECEKASGLACESVNLYHGGQFHLYKYKRFDDVRLAFAPELPIAAFGGDPDNFNFPRWCLDMSFLRVYEDGKPAMTPDHLDWDAGGAAIGEPVFVVGHPGSTDRLIASAELDWLRRYTLPMQIEYFAELRGRWMEWAKTSDEAARQIQQRRLGLENALKVWRNRLASLLNQEQMGRKLAAERDLRAAVESNPKLADAYGDAWDNVAAAIESLEAFADRYRYLEDGLGFRGDLFAAASNLVRGTAEKEKPNGERLREYRETALPRVEQQLFADRPIHSEYEIMNLAFSLEKLRERLGPDDPAVQAVLGQEAPDALARKLVEGTELSDASVRKALWEGGSAAVAASEDPLIAFARKIEPMARQLRDRHDDEVEAIIDQASEKIAKARFAVLGTSVYPDATFSLRVTYGSVRGWEEKGDMVAPYTTTRRLYERATGADPFRLPASWVESKESLNPDTRFNWVADTDIIGGNSGSPMIDGEGRLVGLAFDGNIHSIAGAYWFDDTVNRTVGVHPAIMLEALKKVYGAEALVEELTVVED